MPKTLQDTPSQQAPSAPAPMALSAGVRRHLGQNLRRLYADTLSAPVSQRLEDLIAQLDRPKA